MIKIFKQVVSAILLAQATSDISSASGIENFEFAGERPRLADEPLLSPLIPLMLSGGEVAFESGVVPSFTAIPEDCIQWSDACTVCEVSNGRPVNCKRANAECKFTKCLPFCSKFRDIYKARENCINWYDGCNNCMMMENRIRFVSETTG